jgi:hypothetical protein
MVKCSLNNTFDTKKISHPKALLDVYMKAACGLGNANPQMFRDYLARGNNQAAAYAWIMSFLDTYGKHACKLVEDCLKDYYTLGGNQIGDINKKIDTLRGN